MALCLPVRANTPRDEAEVRALRQGVAVCALEHLQVLRVAGPDAADFIHRMCSADLKGTDPARALPAAFLTPKAHTLATLTLVQRGTVVLCVLPRETMPTIVEHLDRHIIADRVTLEVVEGALLGLYGPRLVDVPLLAGLPALEPDEITTWESGAGRCIAVGDGHLATPGVMLIGDAGASVRLVGDLQAHAERLGSWAHEIARIEAGTPRMGAELGPDRLILEAGELHRVSLTKGCYPGQEPVCRIASRGGVRRVLVGLHFGGDRLPDLNEQLIEASQGPAGWVTSVVHSPTRGENVGLGYLRREFEAVGSEVQLTGGGTATVVPLPHTLMP